MASCGKLWQANQSLTKLIPFGIDIVAVIAIVITKSFSCRMWPYFKGNILQQDFWYNTCDWFCLLAYLAKITITWGRLRGIQEVIVIVIIIAIFFVIVFSVTIIVRNKFDKW